jgi:hypothetical protein
MAVDYTGERIDKKVSEAYFTSDTESIPTYLKDASSLADQATALPKTSRRVHKGLDLCRVLPISSTDTKQDAIIVLENVRVGNDGVIGLGWCVHFGQDFLRQRFRDLVNVASGAASDNALLHGFG